MPAQIQRYTGDSLSGARHWSHLPEDELKRRAAAACRDRDEATLIDLMVAHLTLRGKAGAHVSQHTTDSYAAAVRALLQAWKGESLLHPTRDAAALWVRQLEQSGRAASTVTVRLAGARALYAALRWTGVTDADPFKDVRPAKDKTARWEKRAPFPDEDLERLIAVANPEETVLLLLLGHAALRISEALALTWEDIDLSTRTLVVRHGKGGKRRSGVLSRRLAEALQALPRRSGRIITSFTSDQTARNRLRRLSRVAGVPIVKGRACHGLRHTAGTRLMRERRDLDAVARFLGHEQVETARIYAKWSDSTLRDSVGEW